MLPTEGTVENLARLRSADVDMGLALADVAERDRATGPAQTAPQAVARVYENYLQVIVRDSAPVQRLADLEGLRVSIGPRWLRRRDDQRGAVRGGRPSPAA